ncbi:MULTISPECIES: YciI family protein [unclassified Rhizobium]|uniref:YciI family protein n=1 Tax=Rhizobium TaxID=379 RepID=UPI00084C2F79|nr:MULTISPECIES: YciI family protein [unclassified Rhizobium]OEC92987.1 dehydrogenase [Rhizobium sp. YK2]QYA12424.1 dehydrogenase [Rhizobium sp. AB2/73]UEQ81645.1 dehydrogenase [Rhizobium sp. AB2/73]
MRFLCLIYTTVDVDGRLTPNEMNHLIAEHFVFDEGLRRDGTMIVSDALALRDKSIVIRPDGDTFSVTDGPFVETKEHLAGFYLIEAPDLEEAVGIAKRIPSARYGAVEIRPVRILTLQGDLAETS